MYIGVELSPDALSIYHVCMYYIKMHRVALTVTLQIHA